MTSTQTASDSVWSNCDVLRHIYAMLAFSDQLRLAQVSHTLKYVFHCCRVRRETYRRLFIHKNASDYVVTDESGVNRLCLSPQELHDFLRVYGEHVWELCENGHSTPLNLKQFPKLQSLSYLNMNIAQEHLALIRQYQPELKSLNLRCYSEQDRFNRCYYYVEDLLKFKNLESLTLQRTGCTKLNYSNFEAILSNLPLKKLSLKLELEQQEQNSDGMAEKPMPQNIPLKELEMRVSFEPRNWPAQKFQTFLKYLENLQVLRIQFSDIVTKKILTILATNCKQLEVLHITRSRFKDIQFFAIAPKVHDVALHYCHGLQAINVRQLLSETKLRKFTCRHTTFCKDAFEDFPVCATLECLDLDAFASEEFRSAYENNSNLRELHWYHPLYSDYMQIVRAVPLLSCSNLTMLNMYVGFMDLDIILHMKSLRKMIMPHPTPLLDWSYIMSLLKHSSLTELSIGTHIKQKMPAIPEAFVAKGFPTTINRLEVPFDMLEVALDFWLDLFNCNPHMKLICRPFYPNRFGFLDKLIRSSHFPNAVATIDVCCFNVACQKLRNDFDDTVSKLIYATENHLYYEYNDDLFRIILDRQL
uniref:F-box domain-containing protein n=1 Tax=Stomoxys calcitrans TaxID=35570 RepID=A0A1I8Q9S5_STOCA